ncbi:MAG: AarF/ABC1/UbiB kinase family protein, partial [Microcoleaceae cyanobacterium]
EQPFRLPSQMMFIMKSLTTLDGIARILEPDYNFMIASQPFVKSITVAKGRGTLIGELARQTKDYITYRWNQPSKTEVFLRKLEDKISDGELQFRVKNIESERAFKRIQLALKSIIYACVTGFSFLSGSVLLLSPYVQFAIASFAVSTMGVFFLTRSLFRLWVRENLDKLAEK